MSAKKGAVKAPKKSGADILATLVADEAQHNKNKGGDAFDEIDGDSLTNMVQKLLDSMQSEFKEISDSMISRFDKVEQRIGNIEKNIDLLMKQSATDAETATATVDS
eukprot:gb/GEZN01019473.1/.p1 GENE.gb/GEZN01019473.1/~~gb/GEZN01019473.1/.p1  ORF type:complete len:107 (+),score=24.84 gb/GEZN01019473.1/:38-358(+)